MITKLTQWLRDFKQYDSVNVRGEVSLEIYQHGKLVEQYRDNNLVVTLGRTNIAKLLGGDSAGKKITTFKIGTDGTSPSAGDSSITGAFTKAITTTTYPVSGQVQFDFSVETSEGNGIAILEFGLFNQDGVMVARKTRSSAINKDSSIRIAGSWKIIF